jgi:cytoskeleton protein RodZ
MARRKQRIESVVPVEEPTLPEAEPAVRGVGASLREARERRGWTIPDIAQQLRIRAAVLQAMESGRFEKLPNGAYALGFVRSYADFLGLDRDEIARRVKAEAAALSAPTELVFPKPLSESRMPSGVMLIVSLVLAVGGYGLWYYHSSSQRLASPPRVEAVPERFAAQADRASNSPSKAEAATVATSAPPGAVPSSSASGDTAPAPSAASAPSPAASAPSSPAPATPASSTPAASAASAPGQTTATAPSQPAPQVAALPSAAANSEAAPDAAASASSIANTEPKPVPPPRQYGETDGNSRIVITATADSWVQVRDSAGAVAFSRILRSGDSYSVPNRPGQVLATGSAGALDIAVDGKKAPAIGRLGFTQKDVPLDPARLLAGTAAVETPHAAPKPAPKPAVARPAATEPAAPAAAPAAPATPRTDG